LRSTPPSTGESKLPSRESFPEPLLIGQRAVIGGETLNTTFGPAISPPTNSATNTASLREIAQKSEFTHGVLHYYFSDKVDLICCCVRHYKAKCITRYDQITSAAQSRDELMKSFLEKLGDTVRDEARMHRLWYDLRSQSLFEEAFRDDVAEIDKSLEDMVWRVASRFASLGGRQPAVSRGALYALFDGLFQRCLLRHLSGDRKAIADLREEVERLLPTVA
jgi:AcrR family transcriptional regulator